MGQLRDSQIRSIPELLLAKYFRFSFIITIKPLNLFRCRFEYDLSDKVCVSHPILHPTWVIFDTHNSTQNYIDLMKPSDSVGNCPNFLGKKL